MTQLSEKIKIQVHRKQMLADTVTPVGLYLRLRDRFPGAVLLEGADNAEGKNGRSFIGVAPQAEMVAFHDRLVCSIDGRRTESRSLEGIDLPAAVDAFRNRFEFDGDAAGLGLIGYMGFDAARLFEPTAFPATQKNDPTSPADSLPLLRFRMYRYLLVFNFLKHSLELVELTLPGQKSDLEDLEMLIRHKDIPQFKFGLNGEESANVDDEQYLSMVEKGIAHCRRGDVFQVVLSRRFSQPFFGDEFNVYRALRSINPSPYLFFADYGDYRLFGSSPEAQLVVQNGAAVIHPIAGTYRKTGDEAVDQAAEQALLLDPKENAEHIMLVDLARNDLSRHATGVRVAAFREVHRYSHVIHLVSRVTGALESGTSPFAVLADTFPAGTLSGAPKVRAMQIIQELEPTAREWYGGCIGLMEFGGGVNMAIMIRSFLSRGRRLYYQAGAGIVVGSSPESELREIQLKLGALRQALQLAQQL